MKKTFILLAMATAIFSCGNNETKTADTGGSNTGTTQSGTQDTASNTAQSSTQDVSQNPDYKKGLALIGKSDCLACHKVAERIIGPSYTEVAERYAGKPGIEDSLANKVIRGGSGNWGEQMMTPHPNLSKEDAVSMVKYILLLKQQ
jgi:cytochrome c